MNFDLFMAGVVLAVHFLFILWVILGWLVTRRRPLLRWLQLASVIYGILIEVSNLPCPLTLAEAAFEERAGMAAYREPFVLHYLELVVYPNIPVHVLVAAAVAICTGILGIYLRRYRHRDASGW